MKREIFYVSNILSIVRILLIIPVLYLMIYDMKSTLIIILLITMYISDLLDGYLARKLNQITELGKIIDPIADKIAIVAIAIILFFQGRIETWFFIIVVMRDVLILSFGLYLKSKNKIVLMSDYPGKIAVFSIGIVLILITLNTDNYELLKKVISYSYYISIILITYSLFMYFKRFLNTQGETNGKKN